MGFNKAQNEAIMHGKGPCQVLAGPGSGKTLTIVNRIKYLIERYEVRLESLLGIHIFLIAFSTQEADIELFQLFQTESPNGDVV
mgnify:CR=1 FL=1